jgi:hypothetical protein
MIQEIWLATPAMPVSPKKPATNATINDVIAKPYIWVFTFLFRIAFAYLPRHASPAFVM